MWYCRAKGQKPWLRPTAQDVKTHEEGGHTIWYNELQLLKVWSHSRPCQPGFRVCQPACLRACNLCEGFCLFRVCHMLQEIEDRLKHPIQAVVDDLSLPRAIMDRMAVAAATGQAAYGEQRSGTKNQVCFGKTAGSPLASTQSDSSARVLACAGGEMGCRLYWITRKRCVQLWLHWLNWRGRPRSPFSTSEVSSNWSFLSIQQTDAHDHQLKCLCGAGFGSKPPCGS